MKRSSIFTGLIVLTAMQFLGQTVVWDLVWMSGMRDARVMSALWWAWTIIQIALAIPVGIHLVRWGLARFAMPHAVDRLPAAWVNSSRDAASDRRARQTPRSAMVSA
jgi:hypothetical protein